MPHGSRSRPRALAAALLVATVAVGALRHGGVEPRVAAGLALATLLALALAWPRREGDPELPLLALGLAAGALVVALQLVPLPPALLRLLSPNAAVLFEETLAPIGRWPAWRPLSLAPGETASLLVVAVAVAAAAAAAALLGERRHRCELLLKGIAWTGLAASVGGLLAALLGLGPLLVPRLAFVNPNHLAGFLQLAAWPAFGFALRARGKERVGWLAVFAFTAVGIFLSLSRGGIARSSSPRACRRSWRCCTATRRWRSRSSRGGGGCAAVTSPCPPPWRGRRPRARRGAGRGEGGQGARPRPSASRRRWRSRRGSRWSRS